MSLLPTENQSAPVAILTSHAMLVPWGIFAQCIGLVEALESVLIFADMNGSVPSCTTVTLAKAGGES